MTIEGFTGGCFAFMIKYNAENNNDIKHSMLNRYIENTMHEIALETDVSERLKCSDTLCGFIIGMLNQSSEIKGNTGLTECKLAKDCINYTADGNCYPEEGCNSYATMKDDVEKDIEVSDGSNVRNMKCSCSDTCKYYRNDEYCNENKDGCNSYATMKDDVEKDIKYNLPEHIKNIDVCRFAEDCINYNISYDHSFGDYYCTNCSYDIDNFGVCINQMVDCCGTKCMSSDKCQYLKDKIHGIKLCEEKH